jgi:hypothetical protein
MAGVTPRSEAALLGPPVRNREGSAGLLGSPNGTVSKTLSAAVAFPACILQHRPEQPARRRTRPLSGPVSRSSRRPRGQIRPEVRFGIETESTTADSPFTRDG